MSFPEPQSHDEDQRRGLAPPQFGIATMLIAVSVAALVFALIDVIGAYGTFWLVIFIVAVLAHVAGNSLGKQLREQGSQPLGSPRLPRISGSLEFAPQTRLGRRGSLGPVVAVMTMVGAIAGGVGGGYWLIDSIGDGFTIGALLVALLAFAVLGGIWSFISVGFLHVLFRAWRQSSRSR